MQNVKTRDFKRLLANNGFRAVRSRGSHTIYERVQSLSVPEADTEVNACIAKKLIKEFGLK